MNAYPVSFNLDKFNCRCKHRHEIAKWGKVGKQYWILSSSHISTHPRVQKVNARFYIQRIPFFFFCFNEQTKTAQRKYKFLPSGISWSSTGFEIRSPPSATKRQLALSAGNLMRQVTCALLKLFVIGLKQVEWDYFL